MLESYRVIKKNKPSLSRHDIYTEILLSKMSHNQRRVSEIFHSIYEIYPKSKINLQFVTHGLILEYLTKKKRMNLSMRDITDILDEIIKIIPKEY